MSYAISKQLEIEFNLVVEKVKSELAKEGFGVLTEIDVKSTLKKKLDIDYSNYLILGACNPPFAYQALEAEKNIGLLLPCNVIVYEDDGKINVSAVNPVEAMSMVDNPKLKEIAEQVSDKLRKVIESL